MTVHDHALQLFCNELIHLAYSGRDNSGRFLSYADREGLLDLVGTLRVSHIKRGAETTFKLYNIAAYNVSNV